jgi:hypothetical protein
MAQRWQDLVEVYLAALGVIPTMAPSGWNMHLLLIPTFHHSCWLSFHETQQVIELELVVLQEEPIRSSSKDPLKQKKSRCWEDLVQVPEPQSSALRSLIATIDIAKMENAEQAARDGIFVQCWYYDPAIRHSFVMTSPTPALTPRHHCLVQTALNAAFASIAFPEAALYLQHISRYLAHR